MKSVVALAVALAIASPTLAGVPSDGPEKPKETGVTLTNATLTNVTTTVAASGGSSTSNSSATGGIASSDSHSDSDSSSDSFSGGNSFSVVNSGVRSAPSVFAPSVFPTAGCQGGISLGGSGVNGGGAIGFGFTRRECSTVVLAQNLAAIGLTKAACEALMSTPSAKRVWKDAKQRPVCVDPKEPALEPRPTNEELTKLEAKVDAKIDRAFRRSLEK